MTERKKALLEATAEIREAYIEEAAHTRPRRSWLVRLGTAAATLALVIGLTLALWPDQAANDPIPFFAIRAYAEDGSVAVLDRIGDRAALAPDTSDLFPGKEVYVLDISMDNYPGDPRDIEEQNFVFRHRGQYLVPGDSNEYLSIQWLTEEKDGMNGYRIIGWSDNRDYIEIRITSDERVIHEKGLYITKGAGYIVGTEISYNYDANRTTDELIEAAFNQGIGGNVSVYSNLTDLHGGFLELEERTDAAQKLLALYVRIMNGEQIFAENRYGMRSDWLVGMVLSRDVHWNRLTQEEKELFCSFGLWRDLDDETTQPPPHSCFEGKKEFEYDLWIAGQEHRGKLTISYGDKSWPEEQEHFSVALLFSSRYPQHGWSIHGWFDAPAELTLTVTDEGVVIHREVILVTPTEDGYTVEVLDTTE